MLDTSCSCSVGSTSKQFLLTHPPHPLAPHVQAVTSLTAARFLNPQACVTHLLEQLPHFLTFFSSGKLVFSKSRRSFLASRSPLKVLFQALLCRACSLSKPLLLRIVELDFGAKMAAYLASRPGAFCEPAASAVFWKAGCPLARPAALPMPSYKKKTAPTFAAGASARCSAPHEEQMSNVFAAANYGQLFQTRSRVNLPT